MTVNKKKSVLTKLNNAQARLEKAEATVKRVRSEYYDALRTAALYTSQKELADHIGISQSRLSYKINYGMGNKK